MWRVAAAIAVLSLLGVLFLELFSFTACTNGYEFKLNITAAKPIVGVQYAWFGSEETARSLLTAVPTWPPAQRFPLEGPSFEFAPFRQKVIEIGTLYSSRVSLLLGRELSCS